MVCDFDIAEKKRLGITWLLAKLHQYGQQWPALVLGKGYWLWPPVIEGEIGPNVR